ncbi:hypothetical protein [Aquimarina algicola]|uniref:Uncharacterized protein n=1 Tax=Aquimarina algicola TaxID=2589995 RepID=A0A504J791_9FLAO|nr:hypothetical protein [Aquimarina algicola]TPN82969.1 hypothetical protein FHK87_21320 [Aquimarina algicola]
MKTNEENTKKQRFIESIIDSIQMNILDFKDNLNKGESYELMIYQWINNLFEEKVEIEEAVTIVHQKRLQVLFNNAEVKTPEAEISKVRKRIFDRLDKTSLYNNLNHKNKEYIHSRIESLIQPNLHSCSDIIKIIFKICRKLGNDQKPTITKNLKPKYERKKNTNNNMVLHNLVTPNAYLLNNHVF